MILGDWLCWVLSGMWGGREWWDPPAAAPRVGEARGAQKCDPGPGKRPGAMGIHHA